MNTYNKTDVAAPFGGFKQSGFGKDLGEFLYLVTLVESTKPVFSVVHKEMYTCL